MTPKADHVSFESNSDLIQWKKFWKSKKKSADENNGIHLLCPSHFDSQTGPNGLMMFQPVWNQIFLNGSPNETHKTRTDKKTIINIALNETLNEYHQATWKGLFLSTLSLMIHIMRVLNRWIPLMFLQWQHQTHQVAEQWDWMIFCHVEKQCGRHSQKSMALLLGLTKST